MASNERVAGLFAHFTRLRQGGTDRDTAWSTIEPEVNTLAAADRERLISMLRSWEAKEGQQIDRARPDPDATQHRRPAGLDDARTQAQSSSSAASHGAIRRIQPAQPAQAAGVICPSCGTSNTEGTLYCQQCGAMLLGDGPTNYEDTRPLNTAATASSDGTLFDENMVLSIQIRESNETIRVKPTNHELIIGRQSPNSVMLPDIDLSSYGGETRGVSRIHAALRRQERTLLLTDMGSLNYTYVNGQRLHAHEVRVLRDGDDVRFGQLLVTVRFIRE